MLRHCTKTVFIILGEEMFSKQAQVVRARNMTIGIVGNIRDIRPLSNVVLLPYRTKSIELYSTLARQ